MQRIFLKQGLYTTKSTKDGSTLDLTQKFAELLTAAGVYNTYDCCKKEYPTNGQTLVWDSALSKFVLGSASGGGLTNLGYTLSPLNGTITNSNGTSVILPLVDATNAGLATPGMFNALSNSTPTNAQLGTGNTYIGVSDPSLGAINFVVDGTTVGGVTMVAGTPKWTLNGFVDPEATGYTMATQARVQTISGGMFSSTLWVNSANNHLYRGSVDLETLGGSVNSVFGRSGVVTATNGDYLASQITNTPSGNISAVTVQDALNELDTEKAANVVGTLTLTNSDVTSTDTVSQAIGKLQAQLDNSVSVTVEDNVTSTSTVNALSANQGKLLNDADIVSGAIVGTNLVLTLKGGATVTIDATTLLADVKLTSGVYNSATKALDLTLSDTTLVSIPVSSLLPVTTNATLTGDGATTPLGISLSTDVGQAITLGTDGKILYVPQVIADASETVKGIVELATQVETEAGTSTTLVPTVKTVADTYIKKQFLSNGDLLVGGLAGVETVLAKGTNGQILSVDTSIAVQQLKWVNNTPSRFVKTFVTGDWTIVGAEASLSIPITEHSTSVTPMVRVEEDVTGVFHKVGVSEEISATGNIVLKIVSTSIFNGRVIIM